MDRPRWISNSEILVQYNLDSPRYRSNERGAPPQVKVRCVEIPRPAPRYTEDVPQKHTPWSRALAMAGLVELPLFVWLVCGSSPQVRPSSILARLLVSYHSVPIFLLSMGWLWMFGHSKPPGNELVYQATFWCLIYVVEMLFIATIIFCFSRLLIWARATSRSSDKPSLVKEDH